MKCKTQVKEQLVEWGLSSVVRRPQARKATFPIRFPKCSSSSVD